MNSHPVHGEPAFILHQRPYRESSLLIEALTLNHGRVGLVLRSAKRTGALSLFCPLEITWRGRGELYTLTGVEAGKGLLITPALQIYGLYINELVMGLTARGSPHVRLFKVYQDALVALAEHPDIEGVLRGFELRLLEVLGYGLPLTQEGRGGGAIDPALAYTYDPEQGLVQAELDGEPRAVSGRTLLALAALNGDAPCLDDPKVRHEARRLLRQVISHHLPDRRIVSRAIMQYLSA